MTGAEIVFVVSDSLKALALYESIFELRREEVTAYDRGMNEAVFRMYDTRFHMLDENPEYQLFAPGEDGPKTMWVNITVPDIHEVFDKAESAGCTVLQPVRETEAFGVSSAMFMDSFGYVWMLHQVHREVSFEERCRIMEGEKS